MTESASFTITATQVNATTWDYTMEVTDTGTTSIGTFWFSWVPGAGYLPSNPTFSSPTGWTAIRTDGPPPTDGYSIQWKAEAGAALSAGQSLGGFSFTSTDSPQVVFSLSQIHSPTPVTESTFYSGAPFSDPGVKTAAATMQQKIMANGQLVETDIYATAQGQPYDLNAVDYSPGGAFIGSRFFYADGEEADYDGAGRLTRAAFSAVSGAPAYEYNYFDGLVSGSKFTYTTVPSGASYSSYEIDYDRSGALAGEKFFFDAVSGQPYTTEEEDFDASQTLTRVLLGGFSDAPYSSLEFDYAAGQLAGYKAVYAITGQSFSGEEVDLSAAGTLEKVIYSGLSGTPYQSLALSYDDGLVTEASYGYSDVSGANYNAYQVVENASGSALSESFDFNNGDHKEIALAAGQTLTSLGNDKMVGAAAGFTTFDLNALYGDDVITGFAADDTIALPLAEFSDFDDVFAAALDVNGAVQITASDGDKLTIDNLTKAALSKSTFTFHS